MPGYIMERLEKAKQHGENLFKQEGIHPLGVEQELTWFRTAIESARNRSEQLIPHIRALSEIRDCVEQSGEPALIVKRIKSILRSLEERG